MKKVWDWVSPFGAFLGILFLNSSQFMIFKKMRIMDTENISAADSLGNGLYILLIAGSLILVMAILSDKNRLLKRLSGFLSGLIIVGLFFYSDYALANITLEKTEFSRISIGIGMWLSIISYASVIIKANEHEQNRMIRVLMLACPLVLIAVLLYTGRLNHLGIVMEYETYRLKFHVALIEHIYISLAVIGTGILIGVPLGYYTNRKRNAARIITPFVNITETIPAVSLIAIIMIPLAFLSNKFPVLMTIGISGFGLAAPFIALVLYAIFPIVHNTQAAFKMIDSEYFEIARSIGMTDRQIFRKIKLPLALPVILSGVRIAVVYSIAGATLAAFIGGGGLGTFILQNDSMDFVLLGTLPIITMTFLVDSILKFTINKLSHRKVVQS